MKIALLVLLGLVLGALGGAALGIGAGLAWVEIFKTSNFEGYSGMLVFLTFMPIGAAIGGLGGAITVRPDRGPRRADRDRTRPAAPAKWRTTRSVEPITGIGETDFRNRPHPSNAKMQIAFPPEWIIVLSFK